MKTIDLSNAKELQSVCAEKDITMPESEFKHSRCGGSYYVFSTSSTQRHDEDIAPAYTLDELLSWLSLQPPSEVTLSYQHIDNDGLVCKDWTAWFEIHGIDYCKSDPNPVNAACKLLIWLIKKRMIGGK